MTTPVQRLGEVWAKRDDLYMAHGAPGGKARTCLAILSGETDAAHQLALAGPPVAPTTAVTASSRHSPQAVIVARIAAGLGLRCRIHVPEAAGRTAELEDALEHGAEIIGHRPGYNSVIVKRAQDDATASARAVHVPFGMECMAAVEQTALELTHTDIPAGVRRIVVPVGSGMTLAGVLRGMTDTGLQFPVVGVRVGADPTRRLDEYAVPWWRDMVTWEHALERYGEAVRGNLGRVPLDPIYEAKCLPFLRPDDLFWVVGIRANLLSPNVQNGAMVSLRS